MTSTSKKYADSFYKLKNEYQDELMYYIILKIEHTDESINIIIGNYNSLEHITFSISNDKSCIVSLNNKIIYCGINHNDIMQQIIHDDNSTQKFYRCAITHSVLCNIIGSLILD